MGHRERGFRNAGRAAPVTAVPDCVTAPGSVTATPREHFDGIPCLAICSCLSRAPSTKRPPGPRREKALVDDHGDNGAAAAWLMLEIGSPSLRVVRPWRRRRRARGGSPGYGLRSFYPRRGRLSTHSAPPFYIGKQAHLWCSTAPRTGRRLSASVQWLEFRSASGSDRAKEKGGATTRQGRTV